MMVALRAVELLCLFAIAGAPITLWTLQRQERDILRASRLLLAPLAGVAALAVIGSAAYAAGLPINTIVIPFWCLVVVAWAALVVRRVRTGRPIGLMDAARAAWAAGARYALVGAALVAGVVLWPFLRDGQLVYWQYAGTDGFMYMRIAEYLGQFGSRVLPELTVQDAASGIIGFELALFHSGRFVDKPGTMTILAASAQQLGLLPHEAFSPLNLSLCVMLCLSLFVFGSAMRMPGWCAALFAVFGALSPYGWFVSMNTFFGNALALPILPAILALGPPRSPRVGALGGLLLAATSLLFPDGQVVTLGAVAIWLAGYGWLAWRGGSFRSFGAAVASGLAVWVVLILPLAPWLLASIVGRLQGVLSEDMRELLRLPLPDVPIIVGQIEKYDYLWPAFNLNKIPPQPLEWDQAPFVPLLAGLMLAFLMVALRNGSAWGVVATLVSLLTALAVGVGGRALESDYSAFRAFGLLAFAPLAALFLLPSEIAASLRCRPFRKVVVGISLALVVAMLGRFVLNDLYQFRLSFDSTDDDSNYSLGDLRDRASLRQILDGRSVALGSDYFLFTPTAGTVMLLSSSRLSPTSFFENFLGYGLLALTQSRDEIAVKLRTIYQSDLVLTTRRNTDVFEPLDHPVLYESERFVLVENDLVPFFDQVSFPVKHELSDERLRRNRLEQSRTPAQPTVVSFYSRRPRSAQLELTVVPGDAPQPSLVVAVDGGPEQVLTVGEDGVASPLRLQLDAGLHDLRFAAPPRPIQVRSFHVRALAPDGR